MLNHNNYWNNVWEPTNYWHKTKSKGFFNKKYLLLIIYIFEIAPTIKSLKQTKVNRVCGKILTLQEEYAGNQVLK